MCACAGVKQCIHVCVSVCVVCVLCVCRQRNIEKCFKQVAKTFTDVSQRKTISVIRLWRFYTWCKSRRFLTPLFQLLPIIGFVAPHILKSDMVVRSPLIPGGWIWARTHTQCPPCVLTFVVSCTQMVTDRRWWLCRQWDDNSVWHSRCVHVLV